MTIQDRAGPPPAPPAGTADDAAAAALPGATTAGTVELTPPGSGRAAAIRLVAILVAGVLLAVALGAVPVLIVVLAIIAMIMLHELGHFATAKWSGMKVTEYFLGFGPKLWSVRRGETEYGVKAIPAGGYVRIVGMTMLEEIEPSDEPRSYRQATFPRRFAVGVAGSTMHFILAFALLFALFAFVGAPVATVPTVEHLGTFAGGATPAQIAGLRVGDQIESVDGRSFDNLDNFSAFVGARAGQRLTFVIRRDGAPRTVVVVPANAAGKTEHIGGATITYPSNAAPKGVIGVELSGSANRTVGPATAFTRAGSTIGSMFASTGQTFVQRFSPHGLGSFAQQVTHASSSSGGDASSSSGGSGQAQSGQIISILGAIQIGSQAASRSIPLLLFFLAEVNIFIGVFNLLPMLPLDGGHVAIAIYERARSRPGRRYHADVAKLMPVAYVFLAFIVVLGLGALYMNVVNPVQLPGG